VCFKYNWLTVDKKDMSMPPLLPLHLLLMVITITHALMHRAVEPASLQQVKLVTRPYQNHLHLKGQAKETSRYFCPFVYLKQKSMPWH